MAASTAAREAARKPDEIVAYAMGAVKINKGTMVFVRVADGYAYPGRAGTATDIFVGIAYETIDNSAGVAGALSIRVYRTGSFQLLLASAVQTNIGAKVYAADDQTVTLTSTSNVLVGVIQSIVSSAAVYVAIRSAIQ